MYEVDLASPSLGQDPDEDAEVLDLPGQGFPGGGLDLSGLSPTSQEVAALMDAVAEVSEAEWYGDAEALADEVSALPDHDLDALAAEGGSYPPDLGPDTPFGDWLSSLDDREFANIRAESGLHGDAQFDYLRSARDLDTALANQAQAEHDRRAQDAEAAASRRGRRSARPTDEVLLAAAMGRIEANTYVRGQTADLANDPDIDGLLGVSSATVLDAENEMRYQLTGQGVPLARSRMQPLPPVSGLAAALGLHS